MNSLTDDLVLTGVLDRLHAAGDTGTSVGVDGGLELAIKTGSP